MAGKKKVAAQQKVNARDDAKKMPKIRDKNAPKIPKNAYNRFFAENLQKSRGEFPNSREANVQLGARWTKMSEAEKKPYYDAYYKDRDEYYALKEAYKETVEYKDFQKKKSEKKQLNRRNRNEEIPDGSTTNSKQSKTLQNQKVFSKEFIDYNKEREKYWRSLKSSINEIDEEIGLIDEHVAKMDREILALKASKAEKEESLKKMDATMQEWRRHVTDALQKTDAALSPNSTMLDVVARLEELVAAKNENARALAEIKKALDKPK